LFSKFSTVPMSSRLFSTFSSIRLSESGFILSSLTYLDLSFVQGDTYGYCLISGFYSCTNIITKKGSFSLHFHTAVHYQGSQDWNSSRCYLQGAFPPWSLIEKMPYSWISWRHLANWSSFLYDNSSLCQVDTQNQPVQHPAKLIQVQTILTFLVTHIWHRHDIDIVELEITECLWKLSCVMWCFAEADMLFFWKLFCERACDILLKWALEKTCDVWKVYKYNPTDSEGGCSVS
jgi:hypothetical protein